MIIILLIMILVVGTVWLAGSLEYFAAVFLVVTALIRVLVPVLVGVLLLVLALVDVLVVQVVVIQPSDPVGTRILMLYKQKRWFNLFILFFKFSNIFVKFT